MKIKQLTQQEVKQWDLDHFPEGVPLVDVSPSISLNITSFSPQDISWKELGIEDLTNERRDKS